MRKLLFCLFFLCFPWLWLRAQQRIAFARLPPFERAVVCVKFFEGFHGKGCYPYVGYGHQLQKGEHFSSNMPEWQADSLLRADLMAQFDRFKCYGKDALLLSLLAYNVGAGRILGYDKQPKSQLLRKIESGDRNYIQEYLSFCHYNGKILRGLVKRRRAEFLLFFIPWVGYILIGTINIKRKEIPKRWIITSGFLFVGLRLLGSVFGGCCGLLSQWCGRGTRYFCSASHDFAPLWACPNWPLSFLFACHLF